METANLYNDAINMTEEAKSRLPADSSDSEISAYRSDLVELQKMFGASVDDAGNITDRGEPTDKLKRRICTCADDNHRQRYDKRISYIKGT